jgi:hypothetical protein
MALGLLCRFSYVSMLVRVDLACWFFWSILTEHFGLLYLDLAHPLLYREHVAYFFNLL